MKGFEFILLGIGALAGAFLRYKFVSSSMVIGTLPVNILVVNIIGSFILGCSQSYLQVLILMQNIHYF
jgi:fluoride exporter